MSQPTTTTIAANPAREVTDTLGRKLTIQKLDILTELDLIEAAGGSNAENRRWMMLATLAACVKSINGVPCIAPTTRTQIRAQVLRVQSEGIGAVAAAFNEEIPDEDGAGGEPSVVDVAKN